MPAAASLIFILLSISLSKLNKKIKLILAIINNFNLHCSNCQHLLMQQTINFELQKELFYHKSCCEAREEYKNKIL